MGKIDQLLQAIIRFPIHVYRRVFKPYIKPCCRFEPTCSDYAISCLETYGAFKGSWLIIKRLSRCHPFGGSGHDPVVSVKEKV